jgi:hypothetical protein
MAAFDERRGVLCAKPFAIRCGISTGPVVLGCGAPIGLMGCTAIGTTPTAAPTSSEWPIPAIPASAEEHMHMCAAVEGDVANLVAHLPGRLIGDQMGSPQKSHGREVPGVEEVFKTLVRDGLSQHPSALASGVRTPGAGDVEGGFISPSRRPIARRKREMGPLAADELERRWPTFTVYLVRHPLERSSRP